MATARDVANAYRLFLNREPGEQEWRLWEEPLKERTLTLTELTDTFLLADETERRRLIAGEGGAVCVDLEEFSIWVPRRDWAIGEVISGGRVYEPHVTAELRRLLKPGSTLVDIGANLGYFTLLAAQIVGRSGSVVAFEPRRENCRLLAQSIETNGLEHVVLEPFALGQHAGTATLVTEPGTSNAIIPFGPDAGMPEDAPSETVQVRTLDSFLPSLPRVDVIKMDIEGFEPQAWLGMAETIREHKPVVVFELSPAAMQMASKKPPAELVDHVMAAGYELRVLRRADTEPGQAMSRDSILSMLRLVGEQGITHLDVAAYPL